MLKIINLIQRNLIALSIFIKFKFESYIIKYQIRLNKN